MSEQEQKNKIPNVLEQILHQSFPSSIIVLITLIISFVGTFTNEINIINPKEEYSSNTPDIYITSQKINLYTSSLINARIEASKVKDIQIVVRFNYSKKDAKFQVVNEESCKHINVTTLENTININCKELTKELALEFTIPEEETKNKIPVDIKVSGQSKDGKTLVAEAPF